MKLPKQHLDEFKKRNKLIGSQFDILRALEVERSLWLTSVLKSMGVDINKQWDISPDGKVTEKLVAVNEKDIYGDSNAKTSI